MKKLLKVSLIFLASLLGLIIATISIIVWLVFTPEKLTPIIRNQADKFISCQSEIGRVELTFFSTFPQFGLKVNHLTLINSLTGAPSDTLLSVDQFVGIVDIMSLWNSNELRLSDLSLIKGTINAYIDAEGNNNFNVLLTDTVADSEPESERT
ncbi:MAG: AsmA family protein, partial [Candidatus Thorarchaeota archaeon]